MIFVSLVKYHNKRYTLNILYFCVYISYLLLLEYLISFYIISNRIRLFRATKLAINAQMNP